MFNKFIYLRYLRNTHVSLVLLRLSAQTSNILKGLLHDQTKFHKLLLKSEFVKPNPSVQCLSLGREGCACLVMAHAETGSLILGTYATAVVIIKLKMIANPCEVIAEAGMRWKYILLTS